MVTRIAPFAILLGAGGLTRAYSRAARDALEAAGVARVRRWTVWDVACTYPLLERLRLEIAACGGFVQAADYAAAITLREYAVSMGIALCIIPIVELFKLLERIAARRKA